MIISLIKLFFGMIFNPSSTYRGMKTDGGYSFPMAFMLFNFFLASILSCGLMGAHGGIWSPCFESILLMLVFGLGGSILASLILFPIWKSLGSTHRFLASFKSVAWLTILFPILFFLNTLLALLLGSGWWLNPMIWSLVMMLLGGGYLYLAGKNVHHITHSNAWIAATVWPVIMFIFFGVFGWAPWHSPVNIELDDANNQLENVEIKLDQEQKQRIRETEIKPNTQTEEVSKTMNNLNDTKLGKLTPDDSLLPPMQGTMYYSPHSEEGGREITSLICFVNEKGEKVYKMTVDMSDIAYYFSYAQTSYLGSDSSSSTRDDATTININKDINSNVNQTQVFDAVLLVMNESGNQIAGGITFPTVIQIVMSTGEIYLIGDGEIFDHR